jgi:hypothetical protein
MTGPIEGLNLTHILGSEANKGFKLTLIRMIYLIVTHYGKRCKKI